MEEIDRLQEQLAVNFSRPSGERAIALAGAHELLGLGRRRMVLAIGEDRVAKLAWRREGLLDNEIETRLWNRASEELRPLLCPSIELRASGVLVQARCVPVTYEALGESGRGSMEALAEYGISDVAVNLGLLDERVVSYDYAVISHQLFTELFVDHK